MARTLAARQHHSIFACIPVLGYSSVYENGAQSAGGLGHSCRLRCGVRGRVPLGWIWVASQLQTSPGQATGPLAAFILIAGPLASYFGLTVVVARFSQPRDARPRRMTWNRSRDDVSDHARPITALEQVILLSVLIVGAIFEVWFLFFAHTHPWGPGG